MKTTKLTLIIVTTLLFSVGAFADDNPVPTVQHTEQQKHVTDGKQSPDKEKLTECFRKHVYLMNEPALNNERVCWRAHGNLMAKNSSVKNSVSVNKFTSEQTVDRDYILTPEGQY